jgi:HlyD family secretion protein
MKKKRLTWIVIIAVVVLTGATTFILSSGTKEVYLNTRIASIGTVEITVMATGYVQPVDKVDVGTQVSGVIEKIYVDFNSHVKKGQLLAELDKLTLKEKVTQAEASLISSKSELTYAQQNYDRTKQLYDVKAATDVSYEEATNKLAQAKTSVANAQANLHQANVNLGYADITSPIDGIILNRAVEQGQTVASSFNTPTLFTIANDLTRMQVEADVDEADIGKVKLGQKVVFTVDAYSDDIFNGTVNQIRLQPTVTNNVVTYTVIIDAPNPGEKLFPGMTANITIIAQEETGILVPVEALMFNMNNDIMERLNITSAPARTNGQQQTIWIQEEKEIVARPIKIKIDDGIHAVVESGVSEGEVVVLSASLEKKSKKKNNAVANPLMPRRPNRR